MWYTELQFYVGLTTFFIGFVAHQENLQEFIQIHMCTKCIKTDTASAFDAVTVIAFLIRIFVMQNFSYHCWPIFEFQYLKQQGLECGFTEQEFKINLKGFSCSVSKMYLVSIRAIFYCTGR